MSKPWVVVPVKALAGAKHRLSPVLSESERADLMMAMLEDVLDVLCGMTEYEGLLVATRSRRAQALAHSLQLPTFHESQNGSHSATVIEAAEYTASRYGAVRMLALSADIPGVTRADVRALLAQTAPVVLVPDRHGTGTSAILSDLPLRVLPQFGEDSLRKHRASSNPPAVLFPNTGIAGDIDTVEDLLEVSRSLPDGATRRLLEHSGIAERLALRLPGAVAAVGDRRQQVSAP